MVNMMVVDECVEFFFNSSSPWGQIMNISSINLSQSFGFLLYSSSRSFSKYFTNILAYDGSFWCPFFVCIILS